MKGATVSGVAEINWSLEKKKFKHGTFLAYFESKRKKKVSFVPSSKDGVLHR